jgi:hypothetical protein
LWDRIEAPFLGPLRRHCINRFGKCGLPLGGSVGAGAVGSGQCGGKAQGHFDKQFSSLRGPIMITAANVSLGGTRIDPAKSPLADPFAAEVLGDIQSFMAISARH